MKIQEYVKPLGMVEFKSQYQPIPVTMSVPDAEDVIPSSTFHVGGFYAVKAESSDGFKVTKCLATQVSDFVGSVLERSDDSYSYVSFKHTDQSEMYENTSVVSSLISVIQKSRSRSYIISRNEYEDLMLSING